MNRQESRREEYNDYKGEERPFPSVRAPSIVKHFDTVGDVIQFIDDNKPLWPKVPESTVVADTSVDQEWLGTKTWADARTLALLGWPEGRNWLIDTARFEWPSARLRARDWTYDVAGAFPDVQRFVAGDPESMCDRAPAWRKTRRVISLALSPNCGKDISARERACWGAAILSWLDAEEADGNIVEIELVYLTEPYYRWIIEDETLSPFLFVSIGLKRGGELFSVADLAFWLMHNAAHRRVQFAIRERLEIAKWYGDRTGHVYGDAVLERDRFSEFLKPGQLLLSLEPGYSEVSQALKAIRQVLDQQRGF